MKRSLCVGLVSVGLLAGLPGDTAPVRGQVVLQDSNGLPEEPSAAGHGMALHNVRERLRVVYGSAYQLTMTSEPGKGTCARIELPELTDAKALSA